jgi:hypothetical protein
MTTAYSGADSPSGFGRVVAPDAAGRAGEPGAYALAGRAHLPGGFGRRRLTSCSAVHGRLVTPARRLLALAKSWRRFKPFYHEQADREDRNHGRVVVDEQRPEQGKDPLRLLMPLGKK